MQNNIINLYIYSDINIYHHILINNIKYLDNIMTYGIIIKNNNDYYIYTSLIDVHRDAMADNPR